MQLTQNLASLASWQTLGSQWVSLNMLLTQANSISLGFKNFTDSACEKLLLMRTIYVTDWRDGAVEAQAWLVLLTDLALAEK